MTKAIFHVIKRRGHPPRTAPTPARRKDETGPSAAAPLDRLRAAGVAPVPRARVAREPTPRMRPITGDATIVEFYELSDRAFETPGR